MKITAQIKLQPTTEQSASLLATLKTANAACNEISQFAWKQQVFAQYDLHEATYYPTRAKYGLSAQLVARCWAKVADGYKLDKQRPRTFSATGSIAYDDRILTYRLEKRFVTIWTLSGRARIPFVAGERHSHLLQMRQGESDLVYRKGEFYLLATCTVDEPTPDQVDDALGVDLGIVQVATDSDGESFSGVRIERVRQRQQCRRTALQQVGTTSAKRRLKTNSGRQHRFQTDTNHCISKRLVQKAKVTKRALVLEELTHIRTRTTVRKSERHRHTNWSFAQLRTFIIYKAALAGVQVRLIDPAYSSRTCHRCGCCDKRNRPNQSTFHCSSCAYATNADYNAACNIRDWAAVNQPMVSGSESTSRQSLGTSLTPRGWGH